MGERGGIFMDWYETVNFYQIRLINGKSMIWETNLSYEEAKEEIGTKHFIRVYVDEELHTRAIESIKDITERKRDIYKKKYTAKRRKLGLSKE